MLTGNRKVNDVPLVLRHIETDALDREKHSLGHGTYDSDCMHYSPGHALAHSQHVKKYEVCS